MCPISPVKLLNITPKTTSECCYGDCSAPREAEEGCWSSQLEVEVEGVVVVQGPGS